MTGKRANETARPRDCETARLRDCETTGLRDYGTTGLLKNPGVLGRSQSFSVVRGSAWQLGVRVVQMCSIAKESAVG